ncbi:MAG: TetR/AcrR family transcriptional regulator [Thermoanaerobaculales bacterium]|nr:TetR/AcrR family transcriptional regulator [Thermoanaerobaculales bacterium]
MRLTREDWLNGGFEELKEQGSRALTIDGLCARLGVTKGSFYHHFTNREGFFRALLEEWERRMTDELIEASSDGSDFAERNRRLTRLGLELFDPQLEVEIRVWAQQDAFARVVQERVDRRRVTYLKELFGLIIADEQQAEDLALIRYAFTVGAQHLQPALTPDQYTRLFESLERRLEK